MVTNYATLYIKCTPDDDATVFDSSCTSRLKAANSKAALILPRRNMPRSPPFFAEPHSENFFASSWKSERRRCVGAAWGGRVDGVIAHRHAIAATREDQGHRTQTGEELRPHFFKFISRVLP